VTGRLAAALIKRPVLVSDFGNRPIGLLRNLNNVLLREGLKSFYLALTYCLKCMMDAVYGGHNLRHSIRFGSVAISTAMTVTVWQHP